MLKSTDLSVRNKNLYRRSYCLSPEVYIATALEKQEQAKKKLLKTTVYQNFILVDLLRILKLSFGHMLTYSLYRGIFITSAFLDRVRDNEDFVKLRLHDTRKTNLGE